MGLLKIQLVRHATILLTIEDKIILVDPMLSPKGEMSPVLGVKNQNNNPLSELPFEINLDKIDAVLLTHTHRDHFDDFAVKLLPKNTLIICQPEDLNKLTDLGFKNVNPVQNRGKFLGFEFIKTPAKHGTGEIGEKMAPVSGFVIMPSCKKSIYISGDTIWFEELKNVLNEHKPDISVVFSGAAKFSEGDPITMTKEDIYKFCSFLNDGNVIVTHMDSWNHCNLSRNELKEFLEENNLSNRVYVPDNGEIIIL
ncbi:MBL fold metallo-hydrolase [Methanococcus maripaludis]|uniref:MBL fold metallo-hydrolase n=1 Tax=Methanococcus maripaludis TaxID=39152 RepID=UPI00374443BB